MSNACACGDPACTFFAAEFDQRLDAIAAEQDEIERRTLRRDLARDMLGHLSRPMEKKSAPIEI